MTDIKTDTVDLTGTFENAVGAVKEQDISALIGPSEAKFFKEYIGIQGTDNIVSHISAARAQAWTAGLQYPSISALTWLNPYMAHHPAHDEILRRVKNGDSILDCGCMFAPDLRYLAYSGAPSDNMHGFDIEQRFFHMSYDYYHDRDRFHARFMQADFFDSSPQAPLKALAGKLDIIWAPKFVHLFDKPTQIDVCLGLISLLKPVPGSLFCVSQNGLPKAKEMNVNSPEGKPTLKTATFLLGNEETSKEIWQEVERRSGTEWDFSCTLLDLRTIGLHKDDGVSTSSEHQHTTDQRRPSSRR